MFRSSKREVKLDIFVSARSILSRIYHAAIFTSRLVWLWFKKMSRKFLFKIAEISLQFPGNEITKFQMLSMHDWHQYYPIYNPHPHVRPEGPQQIESFSRRVVSFNFLINILPCFTSLARIKLTSSGKDKPDRSPDWPTDKVKIQIYTIASSHLAPHGLQATVLSIALYGEKKVLSTITNPRCFSLLVHKKAIWNVSKCCWFHFLLIHSIRVFLPNLINQNRNTLIQRHTFNFYQEVNK